MTIKIKMKMLESKLDSGLRRLTELEEDGIPKQQLICFYRQELELEGVLIDYILLSHHIKDNNILHYVEKIKQIIK